jgi:phenylalanine ammonia-lyase
MNSTTDNPIFDVKNKVVVNGGNFQATSISLAMEQLRLVVYHLGKISFA